MKKLYFAFLTLAGILISCAFIIITDKMDNGINMPDWQWTSGEVKLHDTAFNKAFSVKVGFNGCKAGDVIKVTFNSIKVTLSGFSEGTTCSKWAMKMDFLWRVKNEWVPIENDADDWMNQPFMNRNSCFSDSLTNYFIITKLPEDGQFNITVSPKSCTFFNSLHPFIPSPNAGEGK